MSWEHQLDIQKWMGERAETSDVAKHKPLKRDRVDNYISEFIRDCGCLPDTRDVLDGLGLPDHHYGSVKCQIDEYEEAEIIG